MEYRDLKTEMRNPASAGLDEMAPGAIVELFCREDLAVVEAVRAERENIVRIIGLAYDTIRTGGRVFYVGAGTSGRLGVLDASEIRPTFGVKEKLFVGIIAGGRRALTSAIEGAEDDREGAVRQLKKSGFGRRGREMVIGITASGMTPFVLGALEYASAGGNLAALVTCNANVGREYRSSLDAVASPDVGSEIISGSTRLKSGTATKMMLNMISTATMIRLGKVYRNYMVDLTPTCKKLVERALRILAELCGTGREEGLSLLKKAGMNVKRAVVMHELGVGRKRASELLAKNSGMLRLVLGR